MGGVELIENNLLSAVINPTLKNVIAMFDVECVKDGSLMVNSLKQFLGEDVKLCERCLKLGKIAKPFYEMGSRIIRSEKQFMKNAFLDPVYGEAWLKGFTLMMKGIRKFGIQIPFTPGGPFEVVWNFTYKCNLRCKHCYEDAGKEKPELSTEEACRAIDILSETSSAGLPALSFSGGEPLMRKDFFEVATYASQKIPYVSIATNGTLLTQDNVRRLKDVGVQYVEISLDGATKEVHEEFRRVKGCYEKTMQGIRNCITEGLDACIATTVQKDNIGEVEKIIELAEKLDLRFMHFNYIPTGRGKAHIYLDLSPEERFSLLEYIGKKIVNLSLKANEERQKTGKTDIRVDRYFSTCPQYASIVKRIAHEKNEDFGVSAHYAAMKGVENIADFLGGCGAGRLYICLEPNGDIKPCVFLPTNDETIRGNIIKDDFEQIWDQDQMFWDLRTRENLKTFKIGKQTIGCGNCQDKYICGGCRARAYSYFDGDLNGADIGCIDNKELWKLVLGSLAAEPKVS